MGKINVLSEEIANMISAGEVVERPASVVKELVENSIDAGATSICVEIKNGGMTYIRVTDNGSGIEKDDLKTAFLPHATSKIKTSEDLAKIFTLGFRGEALASIAAVSKVEVFTKTKNDSYGRMITVKGGKVLEEGETGCSNGTTIIVRDLFYNTPARMKFLKKDSAEAGSVTDVLNKIILGNPNVSIKYISQSKNMTSQGDGKLLNSIFTVYGKDFVKNVIPVDFDDENIKVTGFIGNSQISRNTRAYQTIFINGRNIVSKVISAALSEGYKNSIMVGKFPFAVINVEINPAFVDVNVHPTKMEVRFSDDKKIFEAVYWATKNALEKKRVVPEIKMETKTFTVPEEIKKSKQVDINLLKDSFVKEKEEYKKEVPSYKSKITINDLKPKENSFDMLSDNLKSFKEEKITEEKITEEKAAEEKLVEKNIIEEAKEEVIIAEIKKEEPAKLIEKEKEVYEEEKTSEINLKTGIDFKIVGQIFSTYIIVEKDGEMCIIDQHAAHERIYFEEFYLDFKNRSIDSQILLIPAMVSLPQKLYDIAMDNISFFEELGFEIDSYGNNVIALRKVAAACAECNLTDLVTEILEDLDKKGSADVLDSQLHALYTMACKRAVKGNRNLSLKEMESIVERAYALKNINTCPHGRPIEIKMTKKDLEKEFKRIV
ncbi:MAG: DNA mismatch repair endonuclease MutL [Ruminococcaceae bacterium]|nr:DNA mismatch repair endonuclease MutL [Oscillospiraceae bacterium]